ncbi:hypothetical protein ACIQC5_23035 [Paenarthrobacter sp. NPDC092416]
MGAGSALDAGVKEPSTSVGALAAVDGDDPANDAVHITPGAPG